MMAEMACDASVEVIAVVIATVATLVRTAVEKIAVKKTVVAVGAVVMIMAASLGLVLCV